MSTFPLRYVSYSMLSCDSMISDTSSLSPPPTSSLLLQSRSPKLGGAPCGEEAEPMSVASVETMDTMSEGDAPPAFTRGSRVRASLPVVRSTNQTKDRSLGEATPPLGSAQARPRPSGGKQETDLPDVVKDISTFSQLFLKRIFSTFLNRPFLS